MAKGGQHFFYSVREYLDKYGELSEEEKRMVNDSVRDTFYAKIDKLHKNKR